MKVNIEKYFKKLDSNIWATWDDYIFKDYINPEYRFYLTATIHCPLEQYLKSDKLEDRMYKIILHRVYNRDTFERNIEDNESILIYKGLIENNTDLDFLMLKLGIIN